MGGEEDDGQNLVEMVDDKMEQIRKDVNDKFGHIETLSSISQDALDTGDKDEIYTHIFENF